MFLHVASVHEGKKMLKCHICDSKLFFQYGNNWGTLKLRCRKSIKILALLNEFIYEHRGDSTYVIEKKTVLVVYSAKERK